ncbi:MAG: glycoside hydrolase family 27 protein [Lachnospiraceae bacterium]
MNKNLFAVTPPMGWNSFDYYDTTVNEEQVKANADYMAAHLKEYGWEYIVVDIQWYAHKAGSLRDQFQYIPFSTLEMDEYSRLLPDPERFPSSKNGAGFKPLADYIHALGLKFGIHIMRGIPRIAAHLHSAVKNTTVTADMVADPSSICRWNPDMYGVRNTSAGQAYYNSLLELYASWGVDYIKCDDICNTNNQSLFQENAYAGRHEIEMLANAIQRCGRSIVLSLSPGPALIEQAWHYETYCNMWRITDDFWDDWKLLKNMFYRCELWQNHVSEGCYPDCDMLPIGYLGKGFGNERYTNFTKEEQRTMMNLWCLFGSPLMIGAELTKLDDWTLSLLTNKNLLALLTPHCCPLQICRDDQKAIWAAQNQDTHENYLAVFNLSDEEMTMELALDEWDTNSVHTFTDLWSSQIINSTDNTLNIYLVPHASVIYKIN